MTTAQRTTRLTGASAALIALGAYAIHLAPIFGSSTMMDAVAAVMFAFGCAAYIAATALVTVLVLTAIWPHLNRYPNATRLYTGAFWVMIGAGLGGAAAYGFALADNIWFAYAPFAIALGVFAGLVVWAHIETRFRRQ